MENDDMKRQAPLPSQRLEQELDQLFGAAPRLPEERLRRVRLAVHARVAQQSATALPQWLRWRTLVPAAAALLLLGGAVGWNLGGRIDEGGDFGGSLFMAAPGGL